MEPIRLIMRAFGPYAGEQVINFSEILEHDLFLITGPTGSGKTSIFDALCFALYGQASGEHRRVDSLRSHFAADDVLTEVELEFAVRGQRYLIHRIPRQERPKQYGSGTTIQQHQVSLAALDSKEPELVGVTEVTSAVEELIGLNLIQFRQIMMLPQGEFSRLLVADSQEREQILSRLFDTADYKALQQYLDESAKETSKEIKSGYQSLENKLRTIKNAGAELSEVLSQESLPYERVMELLAAELQTIAEQEAEAKNNLAEVLSAKEKAIRDLATAEEDLKRISDLETAKAQEENLLLQKDEFSCYENLLAMHRKAEPLGYLIRDLDGRNKELGRTKDSEGKASEEIKACELKRSELDKIYLEREYSKIREREAVKRTEIEKLEAAIEQENELTKLQDKVRELEEKSSSKAEDLQQLKQRKAAEAKLTEIYQEVNILQKDSDAAHGFMREWQLTEDVFIKLQQLIEFRLSAEAEEKATSAELDVVRKTLAELTELEKARTYAELAQSLKDGEPCPICGSLHHPAPAEEVEEAQALGLEELREKEKALVTLLSDKRVAAVLAQNRVTDCEKQLTDIGYSVVSWSSARLGKKQEIQSKIDETGAEIQRLNGLITEIEDEFGLDFIPGEKTGIEQEIISFEKEFYELQQELAGKKAEANLFERQRDAFALEDGKSLESRLADRKEQLQIESEAFADWEAEDKRVSAALHGLEATYKSLKEQIAHQEEGIRKAELELQSAIAEHGFNCREDIVEALLIPERKGELEKFTAEYREKRDNLRHTIKILEDALKGKAKPDLAALQSVIDGWRQQEHELQNRVEELRYNYKFNGDIRKSGSELFRNLESMEEKYGLLGNLANCAKGQNLLGMSFERYVLAVFLDDIITAANMRLLLMTNGRFRLFRSKQKEYARQQSGLDLEVLDSFSGQLRSVKTLSGGESFKAALSMALALSETVQSYAGGVEIRTIFIDEGFGSLDGESLDAAIDCLLSLRESGRKAGIISHVGELKERIPAQLQITSSRSGSKAIFVSG